MNKGNAQEQPKVEVKTYHRLSQAQYQELEKKVISRFQFTDTTGDLQAGALIGVEAVLRELRQGFTVA